MERTYTGTSASRRLNSNLERITKTLGNFHAVNQEKIDIMKTSGVNLAAIGASLTDIEQALRILILIASLVYTVFQIRKMMNEREKRK